MRSVEPPGEHRYENGNNSKDRSVNVVALLFYVHGKHLRSCRDGQLT